MLGQPRRKTRDAATVCVALSTGGQSHILLWVECYSTIVAILTSKFPEKMPELMAYQKTIVRAHRSFIGEGWVTYSLCYRRKAAYCKSLDWGQVDFTLYNETFAGRAKVILRYSYCLSEHHASNERAFAPDISPVKHDPAARTVPRPSKFLSQIYLVFNNRFRDKCRFTWCKYTHLCMEC